jgi:signal transduction histidine kinase
VERVEQQLVAGLQTATENLERAPTEPEGIAEFIRRARPALGARSLTWLVPSRGGDHLEVVATVGWRDSPESANQPIPKASSVGRAWETGEPVLTGSLPEYRARYPDDAPRIERLGGQATAAAPLVRGSDPLGVLEVIFSQPRSFSPECSVLLSTLGRLAAQTPERVRSAGPGGAMPRLERSEGNARFVAEASRVLTSSLQYEETLRRVPRLAVPAMADWCLVHLLQEDGSLVQAEAAHKDPDKVELARELDERWPLPMDLPVGAPYAVKTGQSLLQPRIPPERLAAAAQDEEHLRLLDRLGLHSCMVVPMKIHGEALGALTFVSAESERQYDESDLATAEELAVHAALAIDHARLFRELEQARTEAERAAARLRTLAEADEALTRSLEDRTPGQQLQLLARFAVRHMADCSVTYAVDSDQTLRQVAVAHRSPAKTALLRELESSFAIQSEFQEAMQRVVHAGSSLFVPDVQWESHLAAFESPQDRKRIRSLDPRSLIVVPLRGRTRTVGVLVLVRTGSSTPRYTEEDRALAEELARRAALFVDNARLYQQARAAVQARDEMVAIVSHDLKSPLNAMLTTCTLLRAKDPGPEQRRRYLDRAMQTGQAMSQLVQDLLDVNRMHAGKFHVSCAPVQLAPILDESCEQLRPLAEDKGVKIELAIDSTLPEVRGDRPRLRQVVSNLLGNAIRFAPERGWVRLSTSFDERHVSFAVSDNGPGIPDEQLPRLFEPFWQSPGQPRGHGSGLGLSIAKGIVDAHGGRIDVHSVEKQGTTFTVRLPRAGSPV